MMCHAVHRCLLGLAFGPCPNLHPDGTQHGILGNLSIAEIAHVELLVQRYKSWSTNLQTSAPSWGVRLACDGVFGALSAVAEGHQSLGVRLCGVAKAAAPASQQNLGFLLV